jgi:hypothetical protein
MAMGTRKQREKQEDIWIARTELAVVTLVTCRHNGLLRRSVTRRSDLCHEEAVLGQITVELVGGARFSPKRWL